MIVSLTEQQLADWWDFTRHAGNGFHDFFQLLCPDVLARICEYQFALFGPVVETDLRAPDAIRLLAAADDSTELASYQQSRFCEGNHPPSLFDQLEQHGTISRKALFWCQAKASFNLKAYADVLLNLQNLHENDMLGHDEDTLAHLLRTLTTDEPRSKQISRESNQVDRSYDALLYHHFKQALTELRGFTAT